MTGSRTPDELLDFDRIRRANDFLALSGVRMSVFGRAHTPVAATSLHRLSPSSTALSGRASSATRSSTAASWSMWMGRSPPSSGSFASSPRARAAGGIALNARADAPPSRDAASRTSAAPPPPSAFRYAPTGRPGAPMELSSTRWSTPTRFAASTSCRVVPMSLRLVRVPAEKRAARPDELKHRPSSLPPARLPAGQLHHRSVRPAFRRLQQSASSGARAISGTSRARACFTTLRLCRPVCRRRREGGIWLRHDGGSPGGRRRGPSTAQRRELPVRLSPSARAACPGRHVTESRDQVGVNFAALGLP